MAVISVLVGVDRIVLAGYSMGPVTWTLDGDVRTLPPDVGDDALGGAVIEMLSRPDGSGEVVRQKPVLRAAGVRSFKQLEAAFREVSVEGTSVIVRLDPMVPHRSRGTVPLLKQSVQLDPLAISSADLGAAVREVSGHAKVREG